MAKYIVTDLTRFSDGNDDVCTAVIDMGTGNCLRPMPYFKSQRVKDINMHPGAILEGDLTPKVALDNPHLEDAICGKINYTGKATTDEFKTILDRSLSASVADGFGIHFDEGQKHIPKEQDANCSIITVKILPRQLQIHEDQYKPGKIKASFTDSDGHLYRYLSITDRGFHDFAKKHQNDCELYKVERFIATQEEIYLRIGVGRQWKVRERDGYWLQVNGIYTFPNLYEEIRTY